MIQLITRHQLSSSGGRSRTRRKGPEKDLVDWFLAEMPVAIPPSHRLSIFEEPRIESGFPDLVLVVWDEQLTRGWDSRRSALKTEDLKVLQLLYANPTLTAAHLSKILATSVDSGLRRLQEAGMLYRQRTWWRLRPINQIFAVKQIIAIEAKISDVAAGLDQAMLNTWFANESVLLVPQPIKHTVLKDRASQLQIRVFTPKCRAKIRPRLRRADPVSYVSWMFNEWVWRANKTIAA
jgi:hypothetical protein